METREEMRANFAGESGELWREASPVVVDANGAVLANATGRPPPNLASVSL